MNRDRSFSFSVRGVALVAGLLVVGLGALSVPWLIVKSGVGEGPQAAAQAADAPGAGDTAAGQSDRGPVLLVSPAPTPAGPRLAAPGSPLSGPAPDPGSILALEQRLRALSYMVGREDGVIDSSTRFALTAFQKVQKLPVTGEPDPATLSSLDSAQPPAAAYSMPPEHLEVDISRQVVFVVRGGRVTETLPTSTGNGKVFRSEGRRSRAVTPNGQYAITFKRPGWRRSPLGLLYRPAYFNGGIAFHGAKSVPNAPASHGCVRLPMAFADWFADNASPVGMVVYVYGNPGEPNPAPVPAAAPPPPQAAPAPVPPVYDAPPPPPSQAEAPPSEGSAPILGDLLGGS